MAKKIIEVITSDISGEELAPGQGETVLFSVGGTEYSIDLTDAEVKEFHSTLDPYIKNATKLAGRGKPSRKSTGSGRSPEELAAARAWLKEHGHDVSDRGRVKAELLDLFDKS